jgi:type IV pilus biogenesis protein CpaD/CtpE
MRNRFTRASCAVAALSLLALAGCDQIDPLTRPYVWKATNVNVRNIAAMADDPLDLIRGRETRSRRAIQESDAVEHLWAGKTMPLLGATGGPGGGGSGGGGGAAAPAGGS